MSNTIKKHRKGIIIVILLFIATLLGWQLSLSSPSIPEPPPSPIPPFPTGVGWFKDFGCRQSHSITYSGSESNYPMFFNVYKGSGTSSGDKVYLNYQCQNWPSDINFTDSFNQPYYCWMEDYNSSWAGIWVCITSVPVTNMYVYYGSTEQTSFNSDGDNIFIDFWDAEEASELNDWLAASGKSQIERSTAQHHQGSYSFMADGDEQVSEHSISEVTDRRIFFFYYNVAGTESGGGPIVGVDDVSTYVRAYYIGYHGDWTTKYAYRIGGTWYNSGVTRETNQWHKFEFLFKSGNVKGLIDGEQIFTVSEPDMRARTVSRLAMGYYWLKRHNGYFDDVAIAKYIDGVEHGSWGSEETYPEDLSDWKYRRALSVSQTDGAGTGYPIQINVHAEPPILTNTRQCEQCKPIYYNGKTYVPYLHRVDNTLDVRIRSFNHISKEWNPEHIVTTGLSVDNHFAPSIGMLPNCTLIVFYGSHGTDQKYKISINAEDESSWGTEQSWEGTFTYPYVITFFGEKLYVFVRTSAYVWSRTGTMNGVDWDDWYTIINGSYAWLYPRWTKVGNNIAVSGIARYRGTCGNDRKDVYFAYSPDNGTTWKHADGTNITLPLDLTNWRIRQEELQPDECEGYAFASPVCIDENDKPAFLYSKEVKHDSTYYRWFKIAQWSASLGSSGSWSFSNVSDAEGNALYAVPLGTGDYPGCYNTVLYQCPTRSRPATWFVLNSNNSFCKFVRLSGEINKFEIVLQDTRREWNGARFYQPVTYPMKESWEIFATLTWDDPEDNVFTIIQACSEAPFFTLASSGNDVYIQNLKVRWDFGDVRFAINETNQLDYWMETKVDGVNATFWVEVTGNLSASDQQIYFYYGNPSVTTKSNGYNTFIFFDSFELCDMSGWTPPSGKSQLSCTDDKPRQGSYSAKITTGNQLTQHALAEASNRRVFTYMYDNYGNGSYYTAICGAKDATTDCYSGMAGFMTCEDPSSYYCYRIGATWYGSDVAKTVGWHKFEWLFNSTHVTVLIDNIEQQSFGEPDTLTLLQIGNGWTGATTAWYDTVVVAKYVDPEPTLAWSGEQPTVLYGGWNNFNPNPEDADTRSAK